MKKSLLFLTGLVFGLCISWAFFYFWLTPNMEKTSFEKGSSEGQKIGFQTGTTKGIEFQKKVIADSTQKAESDKKLKAAQTKKPVPHKPQPQNFHVYGNEVADPITR